MKPPSTRNEGQNSPPKVYIPQRRRAEEYKTSTHYIPSMNSGVISQTIGNPNFDTQSIGTFGPYETNLPGKSNIFDISDIDLPVPKKSPFQDDSRIFSIPQKKKKLRKKNIVITIAILFFAATIAIYILFQEKKSDNTEIEEEIITDVPAELLEACQGIEAEGNAFRMSKELSLSDSGVSLTISNVDLSCLPKNSLRAFLDDSPNLNTLIFISSNITVIDTDVFDLGISAPIASLQFTDCNIDYIRDQTERMSTVFFENTRVGIFPRKFPISGLGFSRTPDVQITENLISFLTEKTNSFSTIIFDNFFDDKKIIEFRDILNESGGKVSFNNTLLTIQGFLFSSNSFSTLPEGLFTAENVDFGNDVVAIAFGLSDEFESVEEGAIQPQNGKKYLLSFGGCSKFSNEALETIVNELDVQALILEGTAINDLSGIDFTAFSDFQLLNVENTEVAPLCSEEDAFRESLGLSTEVDINGCLEE
eukprot:snap_masked-scaffold_19-processed-gene-5.16-mRNA-1 protein AED:1.00 eAED:1.00 QI:0/-1/0/0/-1/1/1/0/477